MSSLYSMHFLDSFMQNLLESLLHLHEVPETMVFVHDAVV